MGITIFWYEEYEHLILIHVMSNCNKSGNSDPENNRYISRRLQVTIMFCSANEQAQIPNLFLSSQH